MRERRRVRNGEQWTDAHTSYTWPFPRRGEVCGLAGVS
jgi:hypothetical protein